MMKVLLNRMTCNKTCVPIILFWTSCSNLSLANKFTLGGQEESFSPKHPNFPPPQKRNKFTGGGQEECFSPKHSNFPLPPPLPPKKVLSIIYSCCKLGKFKVTLVQIIIYASASVLYAGGPILTSCNCLVPTLNPPTPRPQIKILDTVTLLQHHSMEHTTLY